jgi:hypothetical protein
MATGDQRPHLTHEELTALLAPGGVIPVTVEMTAKLVHEVVGLRAIIERMAASIDRCVASHGNDDQLTYNNGP